MKTLGPIVTAILLNTGFGWSEPLLAPDSKPVVREWTSTDGKKLTAAYLGLLDGQVALKLTDGKISRVPLVKLSPEDNAFLRENQIEYHAPWQAWPPDADDALQNVPVQEAPGKGGTFVYTTPHFRFISDVNLGTPLMKDLARVFELTHALHTKSPFGILANPDNGLFNARLFGMTGDYMKAGGLPGTAGIYQLKDKVFLAPLELMGVRPGSAGWRKESSEYDLSTVVHELTHMLTHDMLNNLPVWVNEGYAEYISNIQIEKGAFRTSAAKIREGVLDRFVREQERQSSAGSLRVVGIGERVKFQKSGDSPKLCKVEKVLRMTDEEWFTGQAPGQVAPPLSGRGPFGAAEPNRLPALYRTAHLIIYYFIQIEGEKGVLKIRRFLDENRKFMASYEKYRADFTDYETKMQAFMNLPGVSRTTDGRIKYPAGLAVPVAPELPFSDPNQLKLGGLDALLAGESAAVVGARIENALRQDLGVKLRFE